MTAAKHAAHVRLRSTKSPELVVHDLGVKFEGGFAEVSKADAEKLLKLDGVVKADDE